MALNANDIVKIVYSWKFLTPDTMRYSRRRNITITRDGRIRVFYVDEIEHRKEKRQFKLSEEAFLCLEKEILLCLNTADRCIPFVDDSIGTVLLYHPFGRVEKLDRGFGNEDITVEKIIQKYISISSNGEEERI